MQLKRLLVITSALVSVSWPGLARAQYTPDQNVPTVEGVCVSNCNSSSSNSTGDTWGTQLGTALRSWVGRQMSGQAGRDRASQINHDAIAAQQAGNLDESLRLFRQAHQHNANSLVIRANLMQTLVMVAWRDFQARPNNATLSAIERLLDECDGLASPAIATEISYYGEILDAAARMRSGIASVREGERQAAENARALGAASPQISSIASNLAGQLNDVRASPASSSLGFGDPSAVADLRDAPSDPVDARGVLVSLPPNLPRLEQVEHSPGRDAWLRGMDAVRLHDWELATAWFQTAQLRDPHNEALHNAVVLSEWTRAYYRQAHSGQPSTPLDPALRNPQNVDVNTLLRDPAVRAPEDSALDLLFADQRQESRASLAAVLTPEERARIREPSDTDMQFLPCLEAARRNDEAELADLFRPHSRAEVIQDIRNQLTSMSREEVDAAQRSHSDPELVQAARQFYARDLLHLAVVQARRGDFDGAERLLTQATEMAPEETVYGIARDEMRRAYGPGGLAGPAPGTEIQPAH